jgi:hypothetical protein
MMSDSNNNKGISNKFYKLYRKIFLKYIKYAITNYCFRYTV